MGTGRAIAEVRELWYISATMSGSNQYGYLRPRPKVGAAFLLSITAHLALVGALLFWPAQQTTADTLRERAIVTRLVKLGKELDKKDLPRLDAYQPTAPDEDAVNISKEAQIEDAKRKKEEQKEDKKQRDEFAKRMAQSVKKMMANSTARGELGTGRPDGSPDGDATNASEGDIYLTQVYTYIRNNYSVPSIITETERKSLKATIIIYIDAGGKLIKSEFEKHSGNVHFDNALESAVKKASPFPAPPKDKRKVYREQGIGVNFTI